MCSKYGVGGKLYQVVGVVVVTRYSIVLQQHVLTAMGMAWGSWLARLSGWNSGLEFEMS